MDSLSVDIIGLLAGLVLLATAWALLLCRRLRGVTHAFAAERVQARTIFDALPIAVNVLDESGRTIMANRNLQQLIGYSETELLGRTFRDYGHPDDAERDGVAMRELREGSSVRDIFRRDKRYQHKDGHAVPVRITAVTQRDAYGRPRLFVATVLDNGEQQAAELALAESEQRTRAVLAAALDAMLTVDRMGRVTAVNTAAEVMFGHTDQTLCTETVEKLIALDSGLRWLPTDALVGRRLEGTTLDGSGARVSVEVAIAGYELRGEREFTVFVRDISLRREAERRLTRQALHDELTGLPNRTLLNERLEQAIEGARVSGGSAGLLVLDLDGFKEVNDAFGHQVGDAVLQSVARRLLEMVRPADTVGRLGGDEFAIVLPDTNQAGSIAANVLATLRLPIAVEGHSVTVGASIGVAQIPEHGRTVLALLRRADAEMYSAKRSGKGFSLAA